MIRKALLTTLVFTFGMGAASLLPIAGDSAGVSLVPTAWAGPNCDADGDGYYKIHRKCENGDDPNDSDPCIVPDGEPVLDPSCDGGGAGTGADLGSAISLDCMLTGSWGDASGETIKGDLLLDDLVGGTRYSDAIDKVDCSVDGPSTPWPVRLGIGVKGRPENSVRKVDVDLGEFAPPDGFESIAGVDPGRLGSSEDLSGYASLFEAATEDAAVDGYPNMDEMDPIRINVRPYRNDPDQTEDGIHLLPWSETPYEMGMRFSFPGTERFNFSIASQHYPGNESFTGIGCQTGFEQQILLNAPGGNMRDVSVYLWVDDDEDGFPDGYTVSTGTISPVEENGIFSPGAPDVTPGSRYAAVCSSVGPDTCGNPRAPDNCNFLGYVPVQFTMHTRVK